MAVKNGCDLNCGGVFKSLMKALEEKLISEDELDKSLTRLFNARFRLGMFDPPEMVPYAQIPYEVNDSDEHRALALKSARESIVLLKNKGNLLPLSRELKSILVTGPNADSLEVLLGNYEGTPSKYITPLEGIRKKVEPDTHVFYTPGAHLTNKTTAGFSEAVSMAQRSDVVIAVLGLSPRLEGEEGAGQGDKSSLDLPGVQEDFLKALHATGKPVILVLTSGSAVAINWAEENIPAIIQLWYSGEEGGTALADVLFGDYNPAGRLPVTFVKSLDQVPDFTDYSMKNRTYRYMKDEPLYPFGYGLSYTEFEYSELKTSTDKVRPGEAVEIQVLVENIGCYDGDEVVQLYVSIPDASVTVPIRSLQGFARIHLGKGEKKKVSFALEPEQFAVVDEQGRFVVEPGKVEVAVGGSQKGLTTTFEVIS